MPKRMNKGFSVLLSICLIIGSMNGCSVSSKGIDQSKDTKITESNSSLQNEVPETTVNLTVVTPTKPSDKEEYLAANVTGENKNTKAIVGEAVKYDLEQRGYVTADCLAFSEDYSYKQVGIGYYYPDFNLFDNPDYCGVGFVSIIGPEDKYTKIPTNAEYIGVESLDGSLDNAKYNLLAYTCESIASSHFVYNDKYIIYYQLDSSTVKYEQFENVKENYNLSIGSLFDFDNNTYIYDADLFDEYTFHSGTSLYSDINYAELEKSLQALAEEQEANGFYLDEINIVYISPESIEAYLASEEEDTFFGYSVADLENSFGEKTALVYTENGFQTAEYFAEEPQNYNWKSFLSKVGVGCGVIIVGAVLTPITGGASFGCALITITGIATTAALSKGLSTLAIETVKNLMKGYDAQTAVLHATGKGLDDFANGFIIGAVVGSVGVASGLIKPVACFVAGTVVAVPGCVGKGEIDYKDIKDIVVGDIILSYNEITGEYEEDYVSSTTNRIVPEIVELVINEEIIRCTTEHPFYNPVTKTWVSAGSLRQGDAVLLVDGGIKTVSADPGIISKQTKVYNITVNNNHNYYVGLNSILVHNACTTTKSARRKAVKEAWKKEVDAVENGTSKYNWTQAELDELLTKGKVKGYHGCHIKDVHINPEKAADPNNIIFLKREVHFKIVHQNNWSNPSQWGEIIKIMPQFTDQILAMGGLV